MRLVIKIGSSLLAAKAGGLAETRIRQWAKEIAGLRRAGHEVLLVSSGAIRAGMQALGWRKRPTSRPEMQACATIGQPLLMKAYGTALAPHRILVAQILLTSWDLDSRKIYENTRATLHTLMKLKNTLPIFNENDALSFEEIALLNAFGDNDKLSAHVAILARADRVKKIDSKILACAGGAGSAGSVGGMVSKLEAARLAMSRGIDVVITDGRKEKVLRKSVDRTPPGTWVGR